MAEGLDFLIPSLLFMKGALIDNQRSSNKFAASGNRSALCLPGSFRRRGFQPDLLMPQEALLRRGRSCKCCISTSIVASCVYRIIAVYVSNCCNACFIIQKFVFAGINAGYGRKGESYHGDISFYSKDCRTEQREIYYSCICISEWRCDEE